MAFDTSETKQRITDLNFSDIVSCSPKALKEWFTSNFIRRGISYLFGKTDTVFKPVRVSEQGELYQRIADGVIRQRWTKTAGGTSESLSMIAIPDDEIWIVELAMARDETSSIGTFQYYTSGQEIMKETNVAANESVYLHGPLTLWPKEVLSAEFYDIQSGDSLIFTVEGKRFRYKGV